MYTLKCWATVNLVDTITMVEKYNKNTQLLVLNNICGDSDAMMVPRTSEVFLHKPRRTINSINCAQYVTVDILQICQKAV